ncbi:MAG: CBS domain-containing protein [Rudaea sp.]
MKAKDVMTHYVVTIAPDASLQDAIGRMVGHHVSGMPVIDANGALVGIITEGDLVRRSETGTAPPRRRWLELLEGAGSRAEEYARLHGRTVRDVMSTHLFTVSPDAPLAEVARLMEENGVRRIPVVDREGVVGIVSRADLMSALSRVLAKAPGPGHGDEAIRRRIVEAMKRESWCPSRSVDVEVKQGVVEFRGTIFDARERRALRVLAENVEGVERVLDRLICVEPMTGTIIA